MSAFDTTRISTHAGPAARIGAIFTAAVGSFAVWNDARVTRKSLSSLTDRELDDIGLSRGDIDAIAQRY